jgi:hypothetical protein
MDLGVTHGLDGCRPVGCRMVIDGWIHHWTPTWLVADDEHDLALGSASSKTLEGIPSAMELKRAVDEHPD